MRLFCQTAALATCIVPVLSQAITFSNTSFTTPITVGQMFPVTYSAGNGRSVSILFGNSTYSFQVADGLVAPGKFNFPVAVPINVVPGLYQLALLQAGAAPVFSPSLQLLIPPALSSLTTNALTGTITFPTTSPPATTATTTAVTAIYLPDRSNTTLLGALFPSTVYYVYYDEDCSCHKISSCMSSALPTPLAAMNQTTLVYTAEHCGCTTTITAPFAQTVISMPSTSTSTASAMLTNTPIMPSITASPTSMSMLASSVIPTPARYTGGSTTTNIASVFGIVGLVATLLLI